MAEENIRIEQNASPITITDSDMSGQDWETTSESEQVEEPPNIVNEAKTQNENVNHSTPRRSARNKKLRHSNLNENKLGMEKRK